jgi:hypothetical protein
MADKLLISVSVQGATVGDWRGRKIADCRIFDNDEDGLARFKEYLGQFRDVPSTSSRMRSKRITGSRCCRTPRDATARTWWAAS